MKALSFVLIVVLAIAFFGAVIYGAFQLRRSFNYSFGYQDLVQQEIKAMVKKECLIEYVKH